MVLDVTATPLRSADLFVGGSELNLAMMCGEVSVNLRRFVRLGLKD
jgi:hypothetical protein